jgi:starvation-inducible DNA-binding protein
MSDPSSLDRSRHKPADTQRPPRPPSATVRTPSVLKGSDAVAIAAGMNALLADVFALYFKTKNFHWHISGPHFRDYHLMLDDQALELYTMTDPMAERIRKIGANTLRSIGHIGRSQRVLDNDADHVEPAHMLAELCADNQALAVSLRDVHALCDGHRDIASASLVETWLDQAERRAWFLFEAGRVPDVAGH